MGVTLEYLGWSAFVIHLPDGDLVLVDPYLAGHPSQGVPPSPRQRPNIGRIRAVCVSHSATDHLGEAIEICLETGAMLCSGQDVRLIAMAAGLPAEKTGVLVSGALYRDRDWSVKAVAAVHQSFGQLDGKFLTGQPMSFVFDVGGVRVFHGGDTSVHSDLALYGRLYRPHVALIGVGGLVFGGRVVSEMEPWEAAHAAAMLGVDVAVPMHYLPSSGDAQAFGSALAGLAPSAKTIVMGLGQRTEVSATAAGVAVTTAG
jgi:L-ascorbate metabolism protein UlaG (beta-lactamase superfamily)